MNSNHRRPSSLKRQAELAGARAAQQERLAHFDSGDHAPARYYQTPKQPGAIRRAAKKATGNVAQLGADTLRPLAPLLVVGGLAVGIMSSRDDQAPIDPMKLPANEVTRVHVNPDHSTTPEGIAGMIVNNETDVRVLADEIEKEQKASTDSSVSIDLVVPKSQIDPQAVHEYEAGR